MSASSNISKTRVPLWARHRLVDPVRDVTPSRPCGQHQAMYALGKILIQLKPLTDDERAATLARAAALIKFAPNPAQAPTVERIISDETEDAG